MHKHDPALWNNSHCRKKEGNPPQTKQKVRAREGSRDRKLQGCSSERPLLQGKGPDFYAHAEVPSETHFSHLNKTISFPRRLKLSPAASKERALVENYKFSCSFLFFPPHSCLGEAGLGWNTGSHQQQVMKIMRCTARISLFQIGLYRHKCVNVTRKV